MFRYDMVPGLGGAPSIVPGTTALSGTTAASGDWVDADLIEGQVFGEFQSGAVTGTPTSFTATCKLQEADDNSGTGVQDIAQQTGIVISAAKTRGMIRAQRTKRYVRCVATPAFTGGTAPTVPVTGSVLGVLRRVNNLQT